MTEPRGEVFDAVAEAYDRERPGYPGKLVDAACEIGGLGPGSRVLEIGSGTGKLTELLVGRRLVVDAVEPGANMIAFARKRVEQTGDVAFHVGRFEDVDFAAESFAAVFSATAFHWVDPSVGWAKVARLLQPGGTLALIMHIHYYVEGESTGDLAIRDVFERHHREREVWHPLRDLTTLREGVEERGDDVPAVWTWLGHHDLTAPGTESLFHDVRFTTVPLVEEQTADELWAVYATTSGYLTLGQPSRDALELDVRETIAGLGGTLVSNSLAALITARRR